MLPGCLVWNHNEFIDRNCKDIETLMMLKCFLKPVVYRVKWEKSENEAYFGFTSKDSG